jgi:ribosomal protein L11 methyltransferase
MRQQPKFSSPLLEPDVLCEFLMEIGAVSTSVTDADRGTDEEEPIFGEPSLLSSSPSSLSSSQQLWKTPLWNRCHVTAHFPGSTTDIAATVGLLCDTFAMPIPSYSVDVVPDDRDWVMHVQRGWKPILVSNRYLLRFPWHTEDDVEDVLNGTICVPVQLQLLGGIAFGKY